MKILQTDVSELWRPYPINNFNINEWCEANKVTTVNGVPLACQPDEERWEFENRVLKTLQNAKNSELLAQLWQLMGLGQLAFVHEQIIKEKTYLI